MTYFTPKDVLDFIGESPMEIIPGERPLNAILANPPLELITHSAGAVGNTSSAQAKEPTSTGKLGGRA